MQQVETDLGNVVATSTRSAFVCSLARSLTHSLTHSPASLAFVGLRSRSSLSSITSLRRPTSAEKQNLKMVLHNENGTRKRERTPLFFVGEPLCGTRSGARDSLFALFRTFHTRPRRSRKKNRAARKREEEEEYSLFLDSILLYHDTRDLRRVAFGEKRIRGSERSNCRWTKLSLQVVVPSTTANLAWTRLSLTSSIRLFD